ncbi:bifunctional regulatory protein/DNA repair protein [Alcanivorax hongdengensis A-11-3]|uniref:methylated-DNA--[protein]-cysteine S-methyltransferase n=1 Tax=Alcanivorax hongdengensis A-11-3 TaxID=1177179 RepID=L0WBD4_9GAMM|nr:bifunctional DNA-binding transcriptional regulator/O6-methylguanine-DNA methyltransferase Ada [Alcanivorax hongdengensis]EKF74083.1 bifunctional regulatory protein/DNA repair protein [Alcanivorax hongdengensis A-11-3]
MNRDSAVIRDPRWQQIVDRDPRANGQFVYAVVTTGIYCLPSCPSRRARPENIRFYASADAAQQAGYRPCRRCRPDQPDALGERLTAICRQIEQAESMPTLETLARQAGLSRYHLQRQFKARLGLTPRQYGQALRDRRLREALQGGKSATRAIIDAGYSSTSHAHRHSEKVLGMRPSQYARGEAQTIYFAVAATSLGALLVAETRRGLCAISLGDEPAPLVEELQERFAGATLIGGDRDFEQRVAQVVALVEQPGLPLPLPLDIRGTVFQQRVWQALRDIPVGETVSYQALAERLGMPGGARAVARACASNTLALAIPCHRVIRTDGGLSGYRWGIERKQCLLDREKAVDP